MRKFWQEFKAFIAKGNVVDLAVAVIIGQAFNKIVSSLVNDVIMPLISLAVGGSDVSDWKWVISPAQYDEAGTEIVSESALRYGAYIQTILDFLIIALTVFLIVKIFNASKNRLNHVNNQLMTKIKTRKKKNKKGQEEIIEETIVEEVKPVEAPAPAPAPEVTKPSANEEMISLLTEIRDSLAKKDSKKK